MNRTEAERMSIDELEASINILVGKKADIDDQVKYAKRKAAAGDGFSDPDWLGRAELAARLAGRDIKVLQDALGKKKRAEKAERSAANIAASRSAALEFRSAFMAAARTHLPTPTFDLLLDEARKACGQP